MIALLCFFLTLLASLFKSKSRLEAENAALRRQLFVLRRKVRGRVQLTNEDRLFLVQLYRWFPSVLRAITIIPARDPGALASVRLSPVLALEIPLRSRSLSKPETKTTPTFFEFSVRQDGVLAMSAFLGCCSRSHLSTRAVVSRFRWPIFSRFMLADMQLSVRRQGNISRCRTSKK
jgi:hypothetical protein